MSNFMHIFKRRIQWQKDIGVDDFNFFHSPAARSFFTGDSCVLECREGREKERKVLKTTSEDLIQFNLLPFCFFSFELRSFGCFSCLDLLHFLLTDLVAGHDALSLVALSLSMRMLSPLGWQSPGVPLSYRQAERTTAWALKLRKL